MKSLTSFFKTLLFLSLIFSDRVFCFKEKSSSSIAALHASVGEALRKNKKTQWKAGELTTPLLSATESSGASATYNPNDIVLKVYLELSLDDFDQLGDGMKDIAKKVFEDVSIKVGIQLTYKKTSRKFLFKPFYAGPDSAKKADANESKTKAFLKAVASKVGKAVVEWLLKLIAKTALLTVFPVLAPVCIAYEAYNHVQAQLIQTEEDKLWNIKLSYTAAEIGPLSVKAVLEVSFQSNILNKIKETWTETKKWVKAKIASNKLYSYVNGRLTRLANWFRRKLNKNSSYIFLNEEYKKEIDDELDLDTVGQPINLGNYDQDYKTMNSITTAQAWKDLEEESVVEKDPDDFNN